MKKYALYPGVGRVTPTSALGYISGKQLAHCYRIPYSDCLDMDVDAVRKVVDFGKRVGAPPIHLLRLIPMDDGVYRLPSNALNRIIVAEGFHESVNKNG